MNTCVRINKYEKANAETKNQKAGKEKKELVTTHATSTT
jgi:hypothetical protein